MSGMFESKTDKASRKLAQTQKDLKAKKKKKIITITLILTMLLGVSTIAMANDSTPSTEGEIRFKDGDVKIVPPDEDCCPCYGDDPCEGGPCKHNPDCNDPCVCPCHDPGTSTAYRNFAVEDNLFFGEWTIGRGGLFNSANNGHNSTTLNTTAAGKYTGVQIINQTGSEAKIFVTLTEFLFPNNAPLQGAELDLFPRIPNPANSNAPALVTSNENGTAAQLVTQTFVPNESQQILTAQAGTAVKAAWFGILDVPAGAGNQAAEAKAVMTWTDASLTP